MRRGHPRIEIKSAIDYNMICQDMVDEYADELYEMEYEMFLWEDKICRYIKRMTSVGIKYFGEDELNIKCSRMIEL